MWSGLIVWLGIWRVETPVQVVVRVEWLVLVDLGFCRQVLVIGLLGPLTLALSREGERGQSFGCRSIAASVLGSRVR